MILGSTGMLGHVVYHYFQKLNRYKIVDASFRSKLRDDSALLDITDKKTLEKYIQEENPDFVINCIGVLIQGSKADPSNAIYVNSYFPHQLSKILRQTGGKLIHISTDCVFSGNRGEYTESDTRDAYDVYGMSKALGEVINDTDVTIRTSIIGPELKSNGEGLFHWFMKQSGKINGYTKAFWGGVTTLELSRAIDEVINQNITGLVHVTNGVSISKYDLLVLFKTTFNKEIVEIEPLDNKKIDKSLRTSRYDFKYNCGSYENMMRELREFMQKNRTLYSSNYNF